MKGRIFKRLLSGVIGLALLATATPSFAQDYRALSLTGAGYASILDANQAGLNMGLSDFMLEARIKTTYSAATQVLYMKLGTEGYYGYIDTSGYLYNGIRSGGTTALATANNLAVNDGRWHLAIFVVDRSSATGLKLFVDGVETSYSAQANPTALGTLDNTLEFTFGCNNVYASKFQGWFDEVRVWNFGYGGLPADYAAYITWRSDPMNASLPIREYSAGAWVPYANAVRTEIMTDGGLESWTGDNPDYWTEFQELLGTRDITKELVEIHSGAAAAKFEATLNDGATDFAISQTVILVENKYYEFSRWIYYHSETAGYISTNIYNATDGSIGTLVLSSPNGAYIEYLSVFTPTVDASAVQLWMMNQTVTGIVYFDDISIKRVGLVAHWGLDNNYLDETGNNNDLTAGGAGNTFPIGMTRTVVYGEESEFNALSLTGAGYASIADASQAGLNMGLSDFMLEARVKIPTSVTIGGHIIAKYLPVGYYLSYDGTGQLMGKVRDATTNITVTGSVIADARWHYIALVADRSGGATGLKLYLDGALDVSGTVGAGTCDNAAAFEIGRISTTYMEGCADEVRAWNFGYGGLPVLADYEAYILWRSDPMNASLPIREYAAGAWVDYANAIRTELLTNGDMEAVDSWLDRLTPVPNARDATHVHDGTWARAIGTNVISEGAYQDITTVIGKWYEVRGFVYVTAGDAELGKEDTDASDQVFSAQATAAEWTELCLIFQATETTSRIFFQSDTVAASTFWVDDMEVRRTGEVAHYPFDSASYNDGTSNANDLTAGGAGNTFPIGMTRTVVYGEESDFNALSLTGAGYASRADALCAGLDMGLSDFMIEARVKTTLSAHIGDIVVKGLTAGVHYYIQLEATGYLTFFMDDGPTWAYCRTDIAVNDGRWHYVVFVADRSSVTGLKIFIDGTESTYTTQTDPTSVGNLDNANAFYIGYKGLGTNWFDGLTDEVRVWNFGLDGLPADYAAYIAWRADPMNASLPIREYSAGAWVPYANAIRTELLTNGDMEAVDSWTNRLTPTTNARSNEQAHTLTFSRKIVTDVISEGAYQDVTTVIDKWYEVRGWVYVTDGDARIGKEDTDGSDQVLTASATAAEWTEFCIIFQATETTSRIFFQSDTDATSTFYVDDIETRRTGEVAHYPFDSASYNDGTSNANNLTAGGAGNTFPIGMTRTIVFGE